MKKLVGSIIIAPMMICLIILSPLIRLGYVLSLGWDWFGNAIDAGLDWWDEKVFRRIFPS